MIFKLYIIVLFSMFGASVAQSSCRTPNGEISYCVSIYDCRIFVDALKSKNLTSQMRKFLQKSQCSSDTSNVKVCCGTSVNYEDATSETEEQEECGKFYGDQYSKNAKYLNINEYPWAALIGYKNNAGSTGHHCGAVLINKNFVLTAAHCVSTEILKQIGNAYQVRVGEYDRTDEKDCVPVNNGSYSCFDNHQNININNIIIHPEYKYNNGSYLNDIALIKLAKPATYSDFIRPVCLNSENINHTSAGMEYSVVGWGINENSKGEVVKHLVKALSLNNQQCSEVNPANSTISSSQFCAVKSGEQKQMKYCGDTGGALVKQVNDQNNGTSFVLEGIQSFSFNKNNDHKNFIVVYTNVSVYYNWILETIQLY